MIGKGKIEIRVVVDLEKGGMEIHGPLDQKNLCVSFLLRAIDNLVNREEPVIVVPNGAVNGAAKVH